MCERCDYNYVRESMKSLKLHHRRTHVNVLIDNSKCKQDDIALDTDNIDSVTNDEHFPDLPNEENWISFSNNFHCLKIEKREFTTAIH